MENETNIDQVAVSKNKNWLWILASIVAIGILLYFIFSGTTVFLKTSSTLNQNANQPNNQIQNTNPPVASDEDIDNLINQLDTEEAQTNQALNDAPIDVMSDK